MDAQTTFTEQQRASFDWGVLAATQNKGLASNTTSHLYDLDLGKRRLEHSSFHIVPQCTLDEIQAISGQPSLLWFRLSGVVVCSQL